MKYTYKNRSVKFTKENDSLRKWQSEQCSNFKFADESNSLIKFVAKMSVFGLFSPHIQTIFARVFESLAAKNLIEKYFFLPTQVETCKSESRDETSALTNELFSFFLIDRFAIIQSRSSIVFAPLT